MDVVSHLHLDLFPPPDHPHVGLSQFTKKEERGSRLLPQGQLQGVFPAPLLQGFFHVVGDAVEAVRRAEAVDPLVRPLVVVVGDPVVQSLAGVGEGGEDGFL